MRTWVIFCNATRLDFLYDTFWSLMKFNYVSAIFIYEIIQYEKDCKCMHNKQM